MVCKSLWDGSSQKYYVYLREVNIGGHGKTIFMFNEAIKKVNDYKIPDN